MPTGTSHCPPCPRNSTTLPYHGSLRQVPRFDSAVWPLDTFAGDSPVGANNLESESGLRLRRLPLVFMLNGKMIPSLVLQATAQFLGADLASSEVQVGRAIFLRSKDGKLLRTIPIDDAGRMRIRFHQAPSPRGRPASTTSCSTTTSFSRASSRITISADWFAARSGSDAPIPVSANASRPPWQAQPRRGSAQAERTILDQDYVRPLPPMILAALYLLIAMGGAVAVIRYGTIHAAAMLVVLAAFWFESSILAFRLYNVILPLPSFAMLLLAPSPWAFWLRIGTSSPTRIPPTPAQI